MITCGTEELIRLAKQNVCQLLNIGLFNSDEQIEKHFGGEKQLLNITRGYLKLSKDLINLDRMEKKESEKNENE